MRKNCLLLLIMIPVFQYSDASNIPLTPAHYYKWPPVKLSSCVNLSAPAIEKLTGQKLNLVQKLAISFMKGKMKKALRKDPGMTLDKFMQQRKSGSLETGLIIFAIVALILVLVLLVFNRSYDP